MSGIISRSGAPRISEITITTPSSVPTMTKSQRTILATTASMWSLAGLAAPAPLCGQKRFFAPVSMTTPLPSPRRTTDP